MSTFWLRHILWMLQMYQPIKASQKHCGQDAVTLNRSVAKDMVMWGFKSKQILSPFDLGIDYVKTPQNKLFIGISPFNFTSTSWRVKIAFLAHFKWSKSRSFETNHVGPHEGSLILFSAFINLWEGGSFSCSFLEHFVAELNWCLKLED